MVCTRCGAVQRRATARFCHICGATIELAPTNVQPDTSDRPTPEAAPQYAPSIKTVSFSSPEPDEQARSEEQPSSESQLSQPPPVNYPNWFDEAPTTQRDQPPARPNEYETQPPAPFAQPAWIAAPQAAPQQESAAPAFDQQPDAFPPATHQQAMPPESQAWPPTPAAKDARYAPPAWTDDPPLWERQPQEAFPKAEEASADRPERGRAFPAAAHISNARKPASFAERPEPAAGWQAPAAEPPSRAAARGPVPGAFQRSRPVRQRRLPLGVIITLGLLLVFVIAGVGIYAFAYGSGGQVSSAFMTYTDPGHHFRIQYPTVWNVKKLSDGVSFDNATNTAQLAVTYIPNTSNLQAEDFANQEAAKENINTPDSQTFAGMTWVERSGIVTQTSGVSQDIFIFVAAANNLLYEVREAAPLNGYKEPNQSAFMPMLQSLTLS